MNIEPAKPGLMLKDTIVEITLVRKHRMVSPRQGR